MPAAAARPGRRWKAFAAVGLGAIWIALAPGARALAGGARPAPPDRAAGALPAREIAFLDTLERRTFRWFWDLSDPVTGLTPDRAPTPSFSSISAVGFALTAYCVGAERGWVSRAAAAERVMRTLDYLWEAPQDTSVSGSIGYRGFFYHFLDARTGRRFENTELSTVDTALLLGGVLCCQSYFQRREPREQRIRAVAESLYARADWTWAQVRPPAICHGWTPEGGFLAYDWRGYDEAMILQILALGSPSHAVGEELWDEWTRTYRWGTFQGYEHLGFAPLFGHEYTHVWIDLRGIRDRWMAVHGIDYFENSRRATLAQRAYAVGNPGGFRGYGEALWGLSACDGPLDGSLSLSGRERTFRTYSARGASFTRVEDDGTIAPCALAAALPFAPREVAATLTAMRAAYDTLLFTRYGFVDALNPTLAEEVPVHHGRVVAGIGWFDTDCLGIDQGPVVAMIENHRSGLVWRLMRGNPHVVRGLTRAGFTGGWLDHAR